MTKTLNDRQIAEIEIKIIKLRDQVDRLRIKYAKMVGIDIDEYRNNNENNNSIYDSLQAAAASLEEANEILY